MISEFAHTKVLMPQGGRQGLLFVALTLVLQLVIAPPGHAASA
jgi:hypothetical protein